MAILSYLPGTGRGTAGRRPVVEGWGASVEDGSENAIAVCQDVARRNAERAKAGSRQCSVTTLVAGWAIAAGMGLAVDLDAEARREMREIHDVIPKGVVTPEFVALGALAQFSPEKDFGKIVAAAFSTSDADGLARRA